MHVCCMLESIPRPPVDHAIGYHWLGEYTIFCSGSPMKLQIGYRGLIEDSFIFIEAAPFIACQIRRPVI